MRGHAGVTFLVPGRSRRAMQLARDSVWFMTMQEINLFLHSWARHFRYGNSAHSFDPFGRYAVPLFALFIANALERGDRACGFGQIYCRGCDWV